MTVFHDDIPDNPDPELPYLTIGGWASMPSSTAVADAYLLAASNLVESWEGRHEPWMVCYPVFYLCRHGLELYLKEKLVKGARLSSMNPGSLTDWPLENQAALFSILGNATETIGVRLTDKMVIRPLKSISGIYFVSEEDFVNCSLCPRLDCTSRRAKYDAGLYAKQYKAPS